MERKQVTIEDVEKLFNDLSPIEREEVERALEDLRLVDQNFSVTDPESSEEKDHILLRRTLALMSLSSLSKGKKSDTSIQ